MQSDKNLILKNRSAFPKMADQSYILQYEKNIMKLLSSLHNPKSAKYGIYYTVVLASISIVLILEGLNLFHLTAMQHMSTYFEGFVALFMLGRHDMGKAFLVNLARVKLIQKI